MHVENFLERIWNYTSKDARCFSIAVQREKWLNKFFCIDTLFREEEKERIVSGFKKRSDYKVVFVETRDDVIPNVVKSIKSNFTYYNPLPFTAPPRVNANVRVSLTLFADLDFKREVKSPDRETVRKAEDKVCAKGIDHALECYYLDGKKVIHVKRPPLRDVIEKMRKGIGIEPTIAVDSGTGYHLLLLLEYEISVEMFKELELSFLRTLKAVGIKVDEGAKNPARLLRLPGSINPRSNRVASVIFERETKYNPGMLRQRLGGLVKVESARWHRKKERIDHTHFHRLSEREIEKIVKLLERYYEIGVRHRIALYLAGWGAKMNIHPLDISEIIRRLYLRKGDSEAKDRVLAILYSYAKAGHDVRKFAKEIERQWGIEVGFSKISADEEVKGKSGIIEVISEAEPIEKAYFIARKIDEIFRKS